MASVNTGLQLDWARRQYTADMPQKPKKPAPELPLGPATVGAPDLRYRLPVTPTYGQLADRPLSLQMHPKARPTPTLAARDVHRCRSDRRAELWRRSRDFIAHVTAASVAPVREAEVSANAQGYGIRLTADSVSAHAADGRRVAINLKEVAASRPTGPQLELLLEVFEALLLGRSGLGQGEHEAVASAFALLIGVGGLLNPQNAPAIDADRRFSAPKLVCWDFNGTVERGRNAGFRPDVGLVTDSLNAMGATSVITTSVDPIKVEEAMVRANLRFNAYFGGAEVRPTDGNKQYASVAAAYGLNEQEAADHMVTIGDSTTDISVDMPGVIFINSDSDTPAQWVHQLLLELDELGEGSFAQGLQRSLHRSLSDEEQTVYLKDLAFEVAVPRDGKQGANSPKITGLRLNLDLPALVASLKASGGHGMRGSGALRHIENQLPEAELLSMLHAVDTTEVASLVLESVGRRAERRAEEVRVARAAGDGFGQWLMTDPSAKEVASAIGFIVRAGDRQATQALQKFVPVYAASTQHRAEQGAHDLIHSTRRMQAGLRDVLFAPPRASLSPGRDKKIVASLIQAADRWPRPPEPLEDLLDELSIRGCSAELKAVLVELERLLVSMCSAALKEHQERFERRAHLDPRALTLGAEAVVRDKEACWNSLLPELEARQLTSQAAAG